MIPSRDIKQWCGVSEFICEYCKEPIKDLDYYVIIKGLYYHVEC